MTNAFRDYEAQWPADPARARRAALVDLAAGALVGVLVWPFPVARMMLQEAMGGSAALGWAVHVPLLLLFMATAAWLCAGLTVAVLGRTVGMYFADLGFPERPADVLGSLRASCPWTLAGAAALFGVKGPAVRFASSRLGSTRPNE